MEWGPIITYLTGAAIVAIVAGVWRVNLLVSRQNGTLTHVVADLAEHKENDREDFRRLFDRLNELRRD